MLDRFLVVANWKMYGHRGHWAQLAQQVAAGVQAVPQVEVLLCPPFLGIPEVAALQPTWPTAGGRLHLGAQDVGIHETGPHTGEVGAGMLKSFGVSHVLVGHSERRREQREDNVMIAEKTQAARRHQLVPIVCVGETAIERNNGKTFEVIDLQFLEVFEALNISLPTDVMLAYEPVWAIGSGQTPGVAEVAAVTRFLRAALVAKFGEMGYDIRILYGGSISPDNAALYLTVPELAGYLVGGASLQAETLVKVTQLCQEWKRFG